MFEYIYFNFNKAFNAFLLSSISFSKSLLFLLNLSLNALLVSSFSVSLKTVNPTSTKLLTLY